MTPDLVFEIGTRICFDDAVARVLDTERLVRPALEAERCGVDRRRVVYVLDGERFAADPPLRGGHERPRAETSPPGLALRFGLVSRGWAPGYGHGHRFVPW